MNQQLITKDDLIKISITIVSYPFMLVDKAICCFIDYFRSPNLPIH